jgi:DNA polymerase III subunit delta'
MSTEPAAGVLRDLVRGQERLFSQWDQAVREDRLPHAILLLGPRGVGKGRTALALSQGLLCARSPAPCGVCPSCRQVARLLHPDLHLLWPASREDLENAEALGRITTAYASDRFGTWDTSPAASIGIDQVRKLKEEMAKAGVEGDRRVACILAADRMTEQAAQSALKLVEEPPAQASLILTAEDPARLLPTLVSRCQRLRLTPLPREVVESILAGDLGVDREEARLLSALSGGCLGQAVEMKDGGLRAFRDRILKLFDFEKGRGGSAPSLEEVESRVQVLEREGGAEAVSRAGRLLLIWYHDLLNARFGLPEEHLANSDLAAQAGSAGRALGLEEIGRRLRAVEEMLAAIEQNVNPALALHIALGRISSASWEDGLPG